MSETVIAVENLSKRYLIEHSPGDQGHRRYTALRDVIGDQVRKFARKALEAARGRQIVQRRRDRGILGAKGCELRGQARRGHRHHRPQRRGQKHAAQDPQPHHRADRGAGRAARPRRQPAGGRHRFSPGADRARKHLSQRRDPRHDDDARSAESSTRSSPSPRSRSFSTRRSKRYSSGMYVRLAFAVAAHLEPEILIVDEVLAVGDAEFQKKCLGKMDEVSRAGRPDGAVRQP